VIVDQPLAQLVETGPASPTFQKRSLAELLAIPGSQAVIIATSKDPNAKLTVLLVPPGGTTPTMAVKVSTTDTAAAAVERERGRLETLHRAGLRAVATTVPVVVESVDCNGRPALALSGLPGAPMTTSYHRWRHTARAKTVKADFAAVGTWLAAFQTETAGSLAPIDMDSDAALAARFGSDALAGTVGARLRQIHARLRQHATPRTWVHGDFWCGNILMADSRVSGVVDWEEAAESGEPVRDLVRFAITYALYLDRHTAPGRPVAGHRGFRAGAWGAGVAYALESDGWFPHLFHQFLCAGLERLGAPPACWRDAALAGIAEIAASADSLEFARQHLQLFARLTADGVAEPIGESPA